MFLEEDNVSDFAAIRDFLHEYMQHNSLQPSSRQKLQKILGSSRFQRLPHLVESEAGLEGEAGAEDALVALFLLRYAAEWLEQLQEKSSLAILEQNHYILTALQALPLEADPLEGRFYAFVAQLARAAGDEALLLAYGERYQRYQESYNLDGLLLGLGELNAPHALHDWATLYTMLDDDTELSPIAQPTVAQPTSDSSRSDSSTDFLVDFSQVISSSKPAYQDIAPTDFIPPLYNAQNYQHSISSSRQKSAVKVTIYNLNHGQERNFQASLVRDLILTDNDKKLELHLNLTPKYNAIYLLRQIDKALSQVTLVFANDKAGNTISDNLCNKLSRKDGVETATNSDENGIKAERLYEVCFRNWYKKQITIDTHDICYQEVSSNRLRLAFNLPMQWQSFAEGINLEALWQQLDSIMLMVTMAKPWQNSRGMGHSTPSASLPNPYGQTHDLT